MLYSSRYARMHNISSTPYFTQVLEAPAMMECWASLINCQIDFDTGVLAFHQVVSQS
jgi:hypothetical protein